MLFTLNGQYTCTFWNCLKSFSFNISFSRSLALLSLSLALCNLCLCLVLFFSASLLSLLLRHSLCPTQFVTPFSLLLSFFPSFLHSFFLSSLSLISFFLSHRVTSSIRLASSLSPFLTLCIFSFSLILVSLSLSHSLSHTHSLTRSDALHICLYTPREQLAHNITTQNNKEHGRTFAESPERIAEESLLQYANLSLSTSLSLALLLRSLGLSRSFFCLSLSFTRSVSLSNSMYLPFLSPSLSVFSSSLFFHLSLSHFLSFLSQPVTSWIWLTLSLSLPFLLSVFPPFLF